MKRIAGLIALVIFSTHVWAEEIVPATVSLHMSSMHPRDVLAELSRQTGVSISIWPENLYEQRHGPNALPASIDADFDQQTFWSAMDVICTAASLYPQHTGGNRDGITLQEAHNRPLFANRPHFVGPLATVTAESLQRNHTIQLGSQDPQVSRSCGMNISVFIDPRAKVNKYQHQPVIETAEDQSGQSIAVATNTGGHEHWQDAHCTWQLNSLFIPLDYDPQVSQKLATLKGTVRCMVIAEAETIEIDDLPNAQGTEKEVAGLKLVINEVKETERSLEVKINIQRTEMPLEQFRQLYGGIFRSGKFQNSEGRTFSVSGGGGGGDQGLNYTLSTNWPENVEKPSKLVWEIAVREEEIQLPFEFKDLPLP